MKKKIEITVCDICGKEIEGKVRRYKEMDLHKECLDKRMQEEPAKRSVELSDFNKKLVKALNFDDKNKKPSKKNN